MSTFVVSNPTRQPGRSAAALFAGLFVILLPTIATDLLMHATGIYPPAGQPMSNPLWLLAIAYRVVYGVAGCYVAARLAPDRPMGHALLLGAFGLVLGLIGAIVTWNRGPGFGPHWFPIAALAISLPCGWIGGKLHVRAGSASSAH